jgi:predicted membrane-bound spermidine synthase
MYSLSLQDGYRGFLSMLLLGRFQGKNGQIDVVECSRDGTRVYFEEGVRQSQAAPNGESVFTYLKIMETFLDPAANVLILGCGGGNLATRLTRLGKHATVVDINPLSFVIARRFFGLPRDISCITSDFRSYVRDCRSTYDAIAIDVGGPGFSFATEFDEWTCDAIRSRLAPAGRVVMNALVSHDIDPNADRIAARLSGNELHSWVVDEPGAGDRNAIIACLPEKVLPGRAALMRVLKASDENWVVRRSRIRKCDLAIGSLRRSS